MSIGSLANDLFPRTVAVLAHGFPDDRLWVGNSSLLAAGQP